MLFFIFYLIFCFVFSIFFSTIAPGRRTVLLWAMCVGLSVSYYFFDQISLPRLSLLGISGLSPPFPDGESRTGQSLFFFQELKDDVIRLFSGLTMPPVNDGLIRVVGWCLYLAGLVLIVYRAEYGIYLIIFFALIGDAVLRPWYPFVKGFSSRESIFFVHDYFIVSPAETYIILTFLSWLKIFVKKPVLQFYTGPLFGPACTFFVFVVSGLLYGTTTGGSIHIALWEARPIFYLFSMLVSAGNLIQTPKQVSMLFWVITFALLLDGIGASYHYLVVLKSDLGSLAEISEHSAAIHLNTLFGASLAVWLQGATPAKRRVLSAAVPCVLWGYLAMQRRTAFITLAIAIALLSIVLYRENRARFLRVFPVMAALATLYVSIFWSSGSFIAEPIRSFKSVIASNQASAKDQSSDDYRRIENLNLRHTLHQHPLMGVGFGRKFDIVSPMPDISWFTWWEYIPHNSIVWIWLKTGLAGFLSLNFLIGMAIMVGGQGLFLLPAGEQRAIALTASLYILMHFICAYADMSWDGQSMIYVGTAMGVLNGFQRNIDPRKAPPGGQGSKGLLARSLPPLPAGGRTVLT